jgi:serine phosphatase RsbU (regulator of sigma subunit)
MSSALATQRVVGVAPPRRNSSLALRRELETKLSTLQKDYAELHAAIFEAAQVHRRLCAPRLVRCGDFEIANEIFAVRHLAGDFFTVKDTSHGVVLALGDICGKGLAAGMWTTHLVGRVNARATVRTEPEWIVSEVNQDVCLTGPIVPLASLFVARLDPITGKLEYCSAGHPPAMLLRANGSLELLTDGGMLLGVLHDAPYVRGSVEFGAGDVLLVYSDGVIESLNKADEEFGIAMLETQLRQAALPKSVGVPASNAPLNLAEVVSAEGVLFSVLAAVQDFAGTHPLVDDLSVAIIRRSVPKDDGQTSSLNRLHLFF